MHTSFPREPSSTMRECEEPKERTGSVVKDMGYKWLVVHLSNASLGYKAILIYDSV